VQLDARQAGAERRDRGAVLVRDARNLRKADRDYERMLMQDVVVPDILRQHQRHTLRHAAEHDGRPGQAKRRIGSQCGHELL